LAKHETTVVPQLPYSPQIYPRRLFLFPMFQNQFQTIEETEGSPLCSGVHRSGLLT
jgi:hypothetical protein